MYSPSKTKPQDSNLVMDYHIPHLNIVVSVSPVRLVVAQRLLVLVLQTTHGNTFPAYLFNRLIFVRLHTKVIQVSFSLQNSGSVAGHEVGHSCLPMSITQHLSSDPSTLYYSPCFIRRAAEDLERFRQRIPCTRPNETGDLRAHPLRSINLEHSSTALGYSEWSDWCPNRRK